MTQADRDIVDVATCFRAIVLLYAASVLFVASTAACMAYDDAVDHASLAWLVGEERDLELRRESAIEGRIAGAKHAGAVLVPGLLGVAMLFGLRHVVRRCRPSRARSGAPDGGTDPPRDVFPH